MQISEQTYKKMPTRLQVLFNKMPNPAREEVLAAFPSAPGAQGIVKGTEPSKTGDANCYGKYGRVPSLPPRREGQASADMENGGEVGFKMRPGARRVPELSAARFFKTCESSTLELLFCRATSILEAWKLRQGETPCSQENASSAGSSLCLSRRSVASVLNDAAIAASLGATRLSDMRGLSMTATESECDSLCVTLIMAILSSGNDALRDQLHAAPIQNGCRVNIAETQRQTDTTTITISLPKSGGSAESVMCDIIPNSTDHGGLDSRPSRAIYCAKASRSERNAGCDELDDGVLARSCQAIAEARRGNTVETDGGAFNKARVMKNTHPTVKPLALMRYLLTLVTMPERNLILDPFAGSGTTGVACKQLGLPCILIEKDEASCEIAAARCAAAVRDRPGMSQEVLNLQS